MERWHIKVGRATCVEEMRHELALYQPTIQLTLWNSLWLTSKTHSSTLILSTLILATHHGHHNHVLMPSALYLPHLKNERDFFWVLLTKVCKKIMMLLEYIVILILVSLMLHNGRMIRGIQPIVGGGKTWDS